MSQADVALPAPVPTAGSQQNAVPVDSDDDAAVSDVDVSGYRETAKFKTFRKHARDLYQSIAVCESLWATKTVQFLPYYRNGPSGCIEQTVLTGSYNGGQEQNFVKFLSLIQPLNHAEALDRCVYDEELRELGAYGMAPNPCRFKVDLLMAHEGDVRKARVMPHNPNVVATTSTVDKVFVFDRATVMRTAPPNNPARPLLPLLGPKPDSNASAERRREYQAKRLQYNQQYERQNAWDAKTHPGQHKLALSPGLSNCWALDWSPAAAGMLCCGGDEGMAIWSLAEVRKGQAAGDGVAPTATISAATGVNDVKWAPSDANVIAAGTGDLRRGVPAQVAVFDLRDSGAALQFAPDGVGSVVASVDWNPFAPHLLAVGGADGGVRAYDVRRTARPVWAAFPHAAVSEVVASWCPHDASLIATGASDGNSAVVRGRPPTDGGQIASDGEAGSDAACEEGDVLFVHTGHQTAVVDVAWSMEPKMAGQVLTCDDYAICAWKPRNRFLFS